MTENFSRSFPPEEIFPLRLSPFEEYFFVDHRPRLPMNESLVGFFSGQVDFSRLSDAFRRAAAWEPLLFATVHKSWGRFFWSPPVSRPEPTLTSSETSQPIRTMTSGTLPLDRIDLSRELPARFHVVLGPDGFLLHISVHHALADGIGLIRFLGNWFAFYAASLRGEPDPVPYWCEPALLKERENFHIELPEKIPFWSGLWYSLTETSRWFFCRPMNLRPVFERLKNAKKGAALSESGKLLFPPTPSDGRDAQAVDAVMYWQTISAETVTRYTQNAKQNGVSVNSLLTRDLFVGLARWRERIESASEKKKTAKLRLRFLIPTNMRNAHHEKMPLCNMIGYAFLDRFCGECDRSESFLRGIDAQMREIRRWSIGQSFLDGVRFVRRFPGALRFLTSRRFCHATVVFSNTGILARMAEQPEFRAASTIFVPDGPELIRLVGSPPVRPNTPVSVGVIAHHGEMVLTFCVDQSVVSETDRDDLIQSCLDEIRQSR